MIFDVSTQVEWIWRHTSVHNREIQYCMHVINPNHSCVIFRSLRSLPLRLKDIFRYIRQNAAIFSSLFGNVKLQNMIVMIGWLSYFNQQANHNNALVWKSSMNAQRWHLVCVMQLWTGIVNLPCLMNSMYLSS